MKKIVLLCSALMIGSIGYGSICWDTSNPTARFLTEGGGYVDQALIQIVWRATNPATAPGLVNTNLYAPGDFELASVLSPSGSSGRTPPTSTVEYVDADVGGSDILNGYLIIRVFDNASLGVGAHYLQFEVDVDGSLTEYQTALPTTIYQAKDFLVDNSDISASSYQVIPEPAVAGLIGIFGGGMLVIRRIFG